MLTKRSPVEETDITGVVTGVTGSYKEVVGVKLTFKETEYRQATKKMLFVVLRGMGSKLIIRCPQPGRDVLRLDQGAHRVEGS